VLKIVENLWAVGAPPLNPDGELTALPRPPNWWGGCCCPLSKNATPAFGLAPMKNLWHAPGALFVGS